MKRVVVLFVVVCLVLPAFNCLAQEIQKIQLDYTTGASANYTAAYPGDLAWTDGDISIVLTESSSFLFHDTVVSADWSRYDSATSPARARFDLVGGSWTVELYDWNFSDTEWAVRISGNMNSGGGFGGKYWEERTGPGALDGKAWLNVLSVETDPDWYDTGGEELAWDNDNVAGLDTDVTLNGGTDISDYLTDNYSATNGLTLTIFADKGQVVPEPITLVLLGLGGLALRRRQ